MKTNPIHPTSADIRSSGHARWFAVAAALVSFTLAAQGGVTEFANPALITIPAGAPAVTSGNAAPYPSTVTVSGITGAVTAVRVKINLFTHTYPDDVDVFLMSPSGQVSVVFSDAGGNTPGVSNVILVFDDAAATAIPVGTAVISGAYRPTDYDPSEALPPGGTGSIGTNLTALAAGTVNGDWKLFVSDDVGGDWGSIASWALVIEETSNYTVTTTGGSIVVTDTSGNSDTLTLSQPGAGNIKFTAAGRTFSVNGGASITGDSGDLSLTGITGVTVNAGAGTDVINVGAFSGLLPSLTLNGGNGNNTVNLNGAIAFAGGATLDITGASLKAAAPGTDVTLVGSGILTLGGPLLCPITSAVADTGYPRLKVVGGVNLNNAPLSLAGSTFAGAAGNTFTVVDNDGTDPIIGTFAGLPQGAYLPWPGSAALVARISYSGGTGNDVVLTLASVAVTRAFTFNAATDVPVTISAFTASGAATFNLKFAPAPGTNLTLVKNTGTAFIQGAFSNLANGATVNLSFGGKTYPFVAWYYGGDGNNDLVLLWPYTSLAAWGFNGNGQLGDNTNNTKYAPVPVDQTGALAGKTIVQVVRGFEHSLALCSDGTLAAWGSNGAGQLGDNTTDERHAPVLVNTDSGTSALFGKTVAAIAAGGYHSLALCFDGTLAAWGANLYGELGDNTTDERHAPVLVNTDSGTSALFGKTVAAIAAGSIHSLALCSDGTLAAWGSNGVGQLGDNTNDIRYAPVAVNTDSGTSALAGWKVSSLGGSGQTSRHSLAIFGNRPGTFTFEQPSYSANEGSPVTPSPLLKRTEGSFGTVSVKVSTSSAGGSATAGADYTAVTNVLFTFLDGDTIPRKIDIETKPDALVESNEAFSLVLSAPTGGALLGSPLSAKVIIIDSSAYNTALDTVAPTVTLTSPVNASTVGLNTGATLAMNGSASDNKGVSKVQYSLNGAPFDDANLATLATPAATTTTYSAALFPATGGNTLSVRSVDFAGRVSAVATRTFKVQRPLEVRIAGNGSVTAGFSPSSFRDVGQKFLITATPAAGPAPGNIFKNWTIESGHNTGDLGIAASALEKPTLTFIHREGLVLLANFMPNPFALARNGAAFGLGTKSNGSSGVEYNGLIHPDPALPGPDGTRPGNGTEGLLTLTVTSSGAFSGKITIDGSVLNMAGSFDQNGMARFGTSRATTFTVARVNKPSLLVQDLQFDDIASDRLRDSISGTVIATSFRRSVIEAVSHATADRAFYDGLSGATTVPAAYLGASNATQSYTVVLPSRPLLDNVVVAVFGENPDIPSKLGFIFDYSDRLNIGDQISFAAPAPLGLSAGEIYTLVDDDDLTPDNRYLALEDSDGNAADIDDSLVDVLFNASVLVAVFPGGNPNIQLVGLGLTAQDYPQGVGYGFLTITKAGLVTLTTGKLADGTVVTGSSKLTEDNSFPIFLQLYNKKGYLGGDVVLDAGAFESDFAAVNLDWLRPFDATSHYYPYGWEEIIRVGFMGARYRASFSPAASALLISFGNPLQGPDPVFGNAGLSFFDGQLTEDLFRTVSISATNVATKVPASDTSFALTLTAATGLFTGTFVHENDDGVPAPLTTPYEGVIFQKGPDAGGFGFFLTRKPNPIDYTGESGAVNLRGFGM